MRAYKVFNPDWTCRGFQYEVGKTYEIDDKPELCNKGFHACKKAVDCFNYYSFDSNNKVAEVELLGEIDGIGGDKQATNKIKIVKEISWEELLSLVNTGSGNTGRSNSGHRNSGHRNSGDWNSGNRNSGNRNSGHRNSGHRNSGDWNSGNRNSGDWNSGDWNSGNRNSGNRNSGDWNSGDWNSGNRNSGDWNSGDWNSGSFHTGYFNSCKAEKHYIFNKLVSNAEKENFEISRGFKILNRFTLLKYRVRTLTGKYGDYRYMSYKESWRYFWKSLSIIEKNEVRKMPLFDSDVFYEITGIKI